MTKSNVFYRFQTLSEIIVNKTKCLLGGSKGLIYVFHEVDIENKSLTESSCFCQVDRFCSFLDDYQKNICSLEDLLNRNDKNSICVTFDDVPESMYKYAYPLLCEKKIPFLLYISPKLLNSIGGLTEDQVLEMAKNPLCTIGAHTMNHVQLRYEKDSYHDILDSKVYLEKLINKEVVHLAYPFGRKDSVSLKVINEARLAGFKTAVSTIPTKVPQNVNYYFLPRVFLE